MFFHKNHSIVLSNFVPLVNSCRNIKINQQDQLHKYTIFCLKRHYGITNIR